MMNQVLIAALAAVVSTAGFAQADERFNPAEVASDRPASGPIMAAPTAVLFNQGPLFNQAGTPNNLSILQTATAPTQCTLGSTAAVGGVFRLADDFTVPAGETWLVDRVVVFGYQTGATAPSINSGNLRILSTSPGASTTPTIVFGDTTTNRVTTPVTLSGTVRVTETTLTATNRLLQAIPLTVNPPISLTAGTYWIDFQAGGTVASGPFFPPIAGPITATPAATGNALQQTAAGSVYAALTQAFPNPDCVTTTPGPAQGLPFIVEGTISGGATAPVFSFTPAPGATVTATGGTTIGSTGALSITPSIATAGTGTGAPATTTLTCTAPTAPFAGFGQTVTAVGTGAITGGPLAGTCTLGAAPATQTLTCSENRGGTPTTRTWTLSCPAGTAPPAPTIAVNATSTWSLIALMLGLFGFAAVMVRRQG
jgi:hypothetical protein